MHSPLQKRILNHKLQKHGLVTLDDPRSLLQQLALGITSHDKFRALLTKVKPEERTNCYESLRAFLSFEPKPLDVYIAETGRIAEERQLPVWDEVTKMIRDFEVQEIGEKPLNNTNELLLKSAQKVIESVRFDTPKGILQLICRYCTFSQDFSGKHRQESYEDAEKAGWTFRKTDGGEKAACPKCSALRGTVN